MMHCRKRHSGALVQAQWVLRLATPIDQACAPQRPTVCKALKFIGNQTISCCVCLRHASVSTSEAHSHSHKHATPNRKEHSWPPADLPPVEFMGLVDTVGATGVETGLSELYSALFLYNI